MLIDSHTHLTAKDFDLDVDAVIDRAVQAGVTRLITIGAGYGVESMQRAVALAERRIEAYATVGVHPNDAAVPFDMAPLERLAKHPRVVAIGETGLDYYRNRATPEEQRRWFIAQIELARSVQKPIVIHSREAGAECLKILKEHRADEIGGVFHCYAEDETFAARLREINFLVSFPGSLTFKKNHRTREIAAAIPLDQIMVETDAPYMAPEPFRGQRCESAFVKKVAETLALAKGLGLDEVSRVTTANALRLFRLP